ncbi:unnamed protein product [Protopolystoma xenopodis]|uniref:Uncharacterized protein n=1 Tax=Protopolystoma xenopodis TaxID=117903 RepID=A0A448X5W0_9PLAT|nr:unnamed protein product [Protopolystoma xenopodis]
MFMYGLLMAHPLGSAKAASPNLLNRRCPGRPEEVALLTPHSLFTFSYLMRQRKNGGDLDRRSLAFSFSFSLALTTGPYVRAFVTFPLTDRLFGQKYAGISSVSQPITHPPPSITTPTFTSIRTTSSFIRLAVA